jgi:signal peptidase I
MKIFFNKLFKFIKILVLIIIIALVLKAFLFDAFQIPSSSMENTLLSGDFILVNKFVYNLTTPREIPIVNFPIPHSNLFEISKPGINDLVVFEFPSGFESDSLRNGSKYIKRIVAGPHDTLQIINKEFFVNGKKHELPASVKISKENLRAGGVAENNIYPPGVKWNRDNYGPIVIPAKGDTIKIIPENFERWQSVIVMDFGQRSLIPEGTIVTLNGKIISDYVLTQDHYFVIGDNVDSSMDSRHFGFITDNMIIGKALFIYWSFDSEKVAPGPLGFLSAIRANRIFSGLK